MEKLNILFVTGLIQTGHLNTISLDIGDYGVFLANLPLYFIINKCIMLGAL